MNRMVTKGYRKGVYERVTKGIPARMTAAPCVNSGAFGGECTLSNRTEYNQPHPGFLYQLQPKSFRKEGHLRHRKRIRPVRSCVNAAPTKKASMKILLYNPDNGVTRNFMPHLWMFLLQSLTPARP